MTCWLKGIGQKEWVHEPFCWNTGFALGGTIMFRHLNKRTMRVDFEPECPAVIRELDLRESRNFLIGLGNGIWLSALIVGVVYWALQFKVY
jgi:hypothetical protein